MRWVEEKRPDRLWRISLIALLVLLMFPVGRALTQDGPVSGDAVGTDAGVQWDPPVAGAPVSTQPEWDPPIAGAPVPAQPEWDPPIAGEPLYGAPVEDQPVGGEPLD